MSFLAIGGRVNLEGVKQQSPLKRLLMKDVIFREYDIRGIVGKEFLINQAYDLTRAIAFYLRKHNPAIKTIAVGMDGRTHSPAIKKEICRALNDSGIDVRFVGLCPTPALYFALHTTPVDGGLMITASHNAKEYNGIKICLGTSSIWGVEIQEIKKLYKENAHIAADKKGTTSDYPIVPTYVEWLSDHFSHLKKINPEIVIDCANGTAGIVVPDLLKKMGWNKSTLLYPEVDGTYPNHEADPTVEENMAQVKRMLQKTDATFGIGFDGDCDRMAPMTKNGFLVPGDQLLAVFAQPILKQHPGAGIVFDIKSSAGLIELLEKWGADPIMSPSGHSIIKETMQQYSALLGGELSCHFFFKDRYFGYDDGIYAALRLLEIMYETGKSLAELIAIFPQKQSSPELRLACPEDKKKEIITAIKKELNQRYPAASIITLDGLRVTFDFGWGIIRSSNTQPVLSMRFESETHEGLAHVIDIFYELLKPYLDQAALSTLRKAKGAT